MLYTYARLSSVLTANEYKENISADYSLLTEETEWEIIKEIDALDGVIVQAKNELAPHLICRYVLKLAALFNTYYSKVNIKQSDDASKAARLSLLAQLRKTLQKAINIV